ncbi:hypothetical protein ACFQ36_03550 [Arthrobacter sp. GCM10027362]|uniref:hypothetical protein n=1 Tax=Arthrobacter sp. GCM10027362 TaxID=3273379 RepID=UPI0036358A97
MTGSYLIRTASGTAYLVDLTSPDRTVTRLKQEFPGVPDEEGDFPVSALRRDGEPIPLIQVIHLVVGCRGDYLLDLIQDGRTLTRRTTTPIVSIEELKAGDGH